MIDWERFLLSRIYFHFIPPPFPGRDPQPFPPISQCNTSNFEIKSLKRGGEKDVRKPTSIFLSINWGFLLPRSMVWAVSCGHSPDYRGANSKCLKRGSVGKYPEVRRSWSRIAWKICVCVCVCGVAAATLLSHRSHKAPQ